MALIKADILDIKIERNEAIIYAISDKNERIIFKDNYYPYYFAEFKEPNKELIQKIMNAKALSKDEIHQVKSADIVQKKVGQEIKELIVAIGAGVGETFDEAKIRYHKIVLMNDADVDGEHITTLMLTLFFRHMKEVIQKGYLYVAQPPLFRIETNNNESIWVIDETARDEKIAELGKIGKDIKGIQRFKGLGEMQPEQLWNTTMNPATRVLKKINIEDAEEADRVFDMLMGSEVTPRKKFIQTYSKTADLDI